MKRFLRDSASALVLSFLTASFPAGAMEKDEDASSLPAAAAASPAKDLDVKGAAAQGDSEAKYQLARQYLEGRGVEKNPLLAHTFFGVASSMGHVGASYSFGLTLLNGEGCLKDPRAAQLTFCLAAAKGHREAREALVAHFSEMSGEPSEVDFLTQAVLKMIVPASSSDGGNQ
ncbi:MAG: tetratricopeptide repeat protein [Holosporales bacterium]